MTDGRNGMAGGLGRTQLALADLALGDIIGRGGQGEVWTLADRPSHLFKKYIVTPINTQSLARLVHFPVTQLSPAEQQFLYEHCAWPLAQVMDRGNAVGFVMRRAPQPFLANAGRSGPGLRELQYLLFRPSPLWGDIRPLDITGRVALVRDFVEIVRLFHRHQVVVGDISMLNTLWSSASQPRAFLLDCDSMTTRQQPPVLPSPDTVDWTDPQRPPGPAHVVSDRYKIALLVGRVLTNDAYIAPGAKLDFIAGLDKTIADAVADAFGRAAGAPEHRPDADAWARALSGRGSIPLTPPVPRPAPVTLPTAATGRGPRGVIPMRPLPPRP